MEKKTKILEPSLRVDFSEEGFILKSQTMQSVFDLAKRASKSNANVLLKGERGTEKEKIARLIHSHSDRSSGPFITISLSLIHI